MLLITLQN